MSDELADELRGWGNSRENWNAYEFKLGNRAAQHIESLQAELAEARAVIERMKDAVYAHKDNADGNLDSILEAADAAPSSVLDAEPRKGDAQTADMERVLSERAAAVLREGR